MSTNVVEKKKNSRLKNVVKKTGSKVKDYTGKKVQRVKT